MIYAMVGVWVEFRYTDTRSGTGLREKPHTHNVTILSLLLLCDSSVRALRVILLGVCIWGSMSLSLISRSFEYRPLIEVVSHVQVVFRSGGRVCSDRRTEAGEEAEVLTSRERLFRSRHPFPSPQFHSAPRQGRQGEASCRWWHVGAHTKNAGV